jgi:hypothetical protein
VLAAISEDFHARAVNSLIARAEVRAWKCSDGVWHAVASEAWWDEYAPLTEERAPDEQQAGSRRPAGYCSIRPGSAWGR